MLLSLLTLTGDIRLKLGRHGYLLDSYLSLFLERANAILAYEAGSDGFERGSGLRSLISRMDTMRYQERQTRMNLLYASLADEFLPFAVKHFLREAESRIGDNCDIPKLTDLYRRISEVAGETLMETQSGAKTAVPHGSAGPRLCAGGDERPALPPAPPGQRDQ